MTYQEATTYLFESAPLFQNIGAGAYKEGLENTHLLDAHFGHPHLYFRTIHVAGTNGKGSVSHTLAAILQSAGYRTGLYTSPHLVDFRERIRVNGEMIPRQRVVDFVEQERDVFEPLHPSFFELATALAFKYFQEAQVDVAVIEVGLGGRLDCTNIIRPDLSIVTNISFDHVQFLGSTLPQIATEKAGIIKSGIPVVIGIAFFTSGLPWPLLNQSMCRGYIAFFLGVLVAGFANKIKRKNANIYSCIAISCYILLQVFGRKLIYDDTPLLSRSLPALFMLYIPLILLVIHNPVIDKIIGNKVFCGLGAISYALYTLNFPFYIWMEIYNRGAGVNIPYGKVYMYWIMPVIQIGLAVLIHFFIEKPICKRIEKI